MALRPIGIFPWGHGSGERFTAITLSAQNQNYKSYDIWDIPDVDCPGWTTLASNADSAIRDTSEAGDAEGFKIYAQGSIQSRIGFAAIDKPLGNYAEGEVIPVGLAETLKIIAHRNKVLSDANVNLPIPVKSSSTTETQALTDLIASAKAQSNYLQYLYWPMVSYCHAYEPTVREGEVLSEKFKSHKWFLPAPGDALRLSWLARQNSVEGSEFDVYANPIKYGLVPSVPSMFPSTGEGIVNGVQWSMCLIAQTAGGIKSQAGSNGDTQFRLTARAVYPMVQF